jgi:hypothetical protein
MDAEEVPIASFTADDLSDMRARGEDRTDWARGDTRTTYG